jgi:cyclopropane fatty-acyl-phospholipid synthase-like methyltransferase
MDVSQIRDLGRKFDFVQSFEVGEHIFVEYEDNFIDNIARHATMGIVMSWSIIGQSGFMHVNNRDSEYIIGKLQKYGFRYDADTTKYFRSRVQRHFSWTLMVFDKI